MRCLTLKVVLEMPGIEPGAFHMQSERSTTELHPHVRNEGNKRNQELCTHISFLQNKFASKIFPALLLTHYGVNCFPRVYINLFCSVYTR
jgi:hypothetical protein